MDLRSNTMSFQEVLHQHTIAISASDSPDLAYLGLSEHHLMDAMVELARHSLALGAHLLYGGDLRPGGFTELLFEVAERHRKDANPEAVSVTNFLGWPVHAKMSSAQVQELATALDGLAKIVCLDERGARTDIRTKIALDRDPSQAEWSAGLSAMRRVMHFECDARIILGGRVEQYKGSMPGIAEEALLCLEAATPIYILGGFGGCARDIAESVGLADPLAIHGRSWPGRDSIARFEPSSIWNGLSIEENRILARTPHVDQAVVLVLKGLMNLLKRS
jgi:hypothetical protein